ncbi:MAG: uncharacterized protein JWN48_3099 [Myxococcaceae bacterium]|nr:uncharacterized protein [Myxococcaceae bacterium]
MRIDRLELLAFGPFTNKVLDFSQRPRALQLIYGPNEAGKSSTLRGLIGLLYGIDARTQDAHLHDMTRLRIAATLRDELGGTQRVIRRKGLKNTLMNEAEVAIGEGALTPLLGGLDETLFKQMFGLDHERLRQGAEALLRGGGQLGEVLFDDSTGGLGVHTLIESLRAEAESLYKARGRTPELNVALESLKEKKKARNDAVLLPQAYADQQAALADARRERDTAVELRRALGAEKSRLTRLLQLVPVVAKRDAVLAELGQLQQTASARAHEGPEGAPAPLLEQTLQELNRRYGSVLENEREQPAREAELATSSRQLEELRSRLGQSAAELHGLDTAMRARVRKCVEDERKLSSERAELLRQEAGALEERARLEARLEALPALELGGTSALLQELEREDLPGQLARQEAELDKLRGQLARRERQLGLTLDLTVLSHTAQPTDAEVSAFERALEQDEREQERLTQEHVRAAAEHARLSAQRGELLLAGELVTRTALESARRERDAAFDALFVSSPEGASGGSPSAALIRAHAAATERADVLADRMLREVQEAEKLSRLELALAQLSEQQRARQQALTELAASRTEQLARWRVLAQPFGLAGHAPRAARPLLVELGMLREQLAERAQLEHQQGLLEAHAEQRIRELRLQLGAHDGGAHSPDGPARVRLEALCRQARELRTQQLKRARERELLRNQLEKLAAEQSLRRGRGQVIERELASSRERYVAELGQLGVPSALSPDELLACFDELSLLAQRTREVGALRDRLDAARVARETLHADVRALAARALPPSDEPADALPIDRVLAALSLAQRARSEAQRDHRRQREELEKLEQQLVQLSDGVALSELRVTLSSFDPHAARARLEDIERLADEQLQVITELDQRIGRLSGGLEHLEQGAGSAALAEDYEHELSRARALGRRYVEVRLALSLLNAQVERYRNTHQQPVLKRAAELFPRLTQHRYAGLTVEYDDRDEPVLSCVLAGGHTVRIDALSDGTRDQLYLALRIASIEQYFEGRPPLPLILDDALIHFDDPRAAAALEVLGELTRHTQVLFFTHHKRMVELASATLGDAGVQLHELQGRGVPRSDGPLFESSVS